MDLSQFGINTTDGTTGASIPGLGNLQSILGTVTVISLIATGLFLVLYLINIIQRIRADRAMIAMHKDIVAIRAVLEQHATPATAPAPTMPIAAEPIRDESESSLTN